MTKHQAPSTKHLSREQATRLHEALELRGWSVPLTARRAGLNRDMVDDVLRGNGLDSKCGVCLAHALGVDARWLILGQPSAAGGAMRSLVLFAHKSALDQRCRQALASFCAAYCGLVPEPDKGPGVCRYCLCTDAMGCGDCTWVDEAATICSSCLEPQS